MIIDEKYIYLEDQELIDKFTFIDDNREIPESIQNYILEIVMNELCIRKNKNNLRQSLEELPKDFIDSVIRNIDVNMYSKIEKTDYTNKHLIYLLYYLPSNIYKIWHPLLDLLVQGRLKTHISLMDIGTGPGSVPIGVIEFYRILANYFNNVEFVIDFKLIDAEEKFLKYTEIIINKIKETLPCNLKVLFKTCRLSIHNETKIGCESKFDIISMSNFLNHFEHNWEFDSFSFLSGLRSLLTRDGSLIIIEPGSKDECINMKKLRNKLINNRVYNIYAPCIPLWECKDKYTCSCFSTYTLLWKKPEIIEYLHNKGLNKIKYRNHVAFNYMILRLDESKKYSIEPNRLNYSLLSEIPALKTERINVKGIVKTKSLQNLSFSICDGSFNEMNYYDVWVNIKDSVKYKFQNKVRLINMGELVKLRGIKVASISAGKINLIIDERSKLEINY